MIDWLMEWIIEHGQNLIIALAFVSALLFLLRVRIIQHQQREELPEAVIEETEITAYPEDFPNVGKPLKNNDINAESIPDLNKNEQLLVQVMGNDKFKVEGEIKAFKNKFKITTKKEKETPEEPPMTEAEIDDMRAEHQKQMEKKLEDAGVDLSKQPSDKQDDEVEKPEEGWDKHMKETLGEEKAAKNGSKKK